MPIPFLFCLAATVTADATVLSVLGKAEFSTPDGNTQPLVRFAILPQGATVATFEESFAAIRFPDGSFLRMGANTQMTLGRIEQREPAARRRTTVKLAVGRVWARVMGLFGDESRFELESPNAVAGVRGTAFFAEVRDGTDTYTVDDGALALRRGDAAIDLVGPGATVSTEGAGFGPLVHLSPAALTALRQGLSNTAGAFVDSERHRDHSPEPPDDARAHLRAVLTGPDRVADTPVHLPSAADDLRGDATVQVRIRLPAAP